MSEPDTVAAGLLYRLRTDAAYLQHTRRVVLRRVCDDLLEAADALQAETTARLALEAKLAQTEHALGRTREIADTLRAGIQTHLDGGYPHPRAYRPGQCEHGTWYYDECEDCNTAHLKHVLEQADALASKEPQPSAPTSDQKETSHG